MKEAHMKVIQPFFLTIIFTSAALNAGDNNPVADIAAAKQSNNETPLQREYIEPGPLSETTSLLSLVPDAETVSLLRAAVITFKKPQKNETNNPEDLLNSYEAVGRLDPDGKAATTEDVLDKCDDYAATKYYEAKNDRETKIEREKYFKSKHQ